MSEPCCEYGPPGHTEQQHHDASACYDMTCRFDHPLGGPYCPGDSLGDHGPRCDCPPAPNESLPASANSAEGDSA